MLAGVHHARDENSSFPKRIEISDVKSLIDARLNGKFTLSEQAAALAEYILYPASEAARTSFASVLRSCADPLRLNLKGMRRIQYRWLRAADVFHSYYDMAAGGSRPHMARLRRLYHLRLGPLSGAYRTNSAPASKGS
jgi:hypothetical protein